MTFYFLFLNIKRYKKSSIRIKNNKYKLCWDQYLQFTLINIPRRVKSF